MGDRPARLARESGAFSSVTIDGVRHLAYHLTLKLLTPYHCLWSDTAKFSEGNFRDVDRWLSKNEFIAKYTKTRLSEILRT